MLTHFCRWSGMFYKQESSNMMTQCERCDYRQ